MLDWKPMHLRKYVDRELFALFYVGNHYLNFYGAFLHNLHSLKDKSKVELQFYFLITLSSRQVQCQIN